MKFADTSWWATWVLPGDARHRDALVMLGHLGDNEQILTTNLIVGETWTLLRHRGSHRTAVGFLDRIRSLDSAGKLTVHTVTGEQESRAWNWLRRHDERKYSFVDATSFEVMRDRRLREALAFDNDFAAAGFLELRPLRAGAGVNDDSSLGGRVGSPAVAFLQPENIPSRNDVPARLRTVAKCLREFLPDEVTVWLERTGDGERRALEKEFDQQRFEGLAGSDDGSEAYLVVLDPAAGILVLEAPSRIRVRRRHGRRAKVDGDRIRDLTERRVSELRDKLDAGSIPELPVRVALALPDVSASDVRSMRAEVPVLCADDFSREGLAPALREILGGGRREIQPAQESAARAAVNPEIVIRGTQGQLFAPVTDRDDEEILRTLDREQEHLARSLGPGYRLIRGVAGSGKTLVLTSRARHMAGHFRHWRILLICFNKALSLALAQHVAEHTNVRVYTLDALALRVLNKTGRSPDDERRPTSISGVGTPRKLRPVSTSPSSSTWCWLTRPRTSTRWASTWPGRCSNQTATTS